MKLLVKFPTRGRPAKFFRVLFEYIQKCKNLQDTSFFISMDNDDQSMNNLSVQQNLKQIAERVNLRYHYSNNSSKIEAANSYMGYLLGWEIVLLASDDMIPVVEGYDEVIRKDMTDHFPDTDGCLWYYDGGQKNICTLSILGKRYFDRFGYIYHPEYKSLWADNEHTDVMTKLGKVYRSDRMIIEHQHPHYRKTYYDLVYFKNDKYDSYDRKVYQRRKAQNFDLKEIDGKYTK